MRVSVLLVLFFSIMSIFSFIVLNISISLSSSQECLCDQSYESDGGDVPRTYGVVRHRYCEGGKCVESNYYDECYGQICGRDNLREYYLNVSNNRVHSRNYINLFAEKKYCKNGALYEDISNPIVNLNPSSREWGNSDIRVVLSCNDNDESGCHRYNYTLIRVV